jgi:hypothetical protein
MKIILCILLGLLCGGKTDAQVPHDLTAKPENGFVPDETTAVAIAKAVWVPIYGKKMLRQERPFRATLRNGVWTVRGSIPRGNKGGAAFAEISKTSGLILRVYHEY